MSTKTWFILFIGAFLWICYEYNQNPEAFVKGLGEGVLLILGIIGVAVFWIIVTSLGKENKSDDSNDSTTYRGKKY